MRNLMAGALVALSLSTQAYAAIQEEAVTYKDGDTVHEGFRRLRRREEGQAPGHRRRARVVGDHQAHARGGAPLRTAGLHGVRRRHVRRREDRRQPHGRRRADEVGAWAMRRSCKAASTRRREQLAKHAKRRCQAESAHRATAWAARSCSARRGPASTSPASRHFTRASAAIAPARARSRRRCWC